MAKNGYTINREKYKAIKKYDHAQMDNFCQMVYNSGFEDGSKKGFDAGYQHGFQTAKENTAAFLPELLERRIGEIKGIGAKKLAEIMAVILSEIPEGKKG